MSYNFMSFIICLFSLVIIIVYIYESSKLQKFIIKDKTFMIEKYKNLQDKNDSLQTLYSIRTRLDHLISHLLNKYPDDVNMKRLEFRYKDTILKEANPDINFPGKTSYTMRGVNKSGSSVFMQIANCGFNF